MMHIHTLGENNLTVNGDDKNLIFGNVPKARLLGFKRFAIPVEMFERSKTCL